MSASLCTSPGRLAVALVFLLCAPRLGRAESNAADAAPVDPGLGAPVDEASDHDARVDDTHVDDTHVDDALAQATAREETDDLALGADPVPDAAEPEPVEPACGPSLPGCFLDRQGHWRAFEPAYVAAHAVPERHYGVALVEDLVFVGVGAIWYFAAIEDNKLDWDIESLRMRFSRDSVRYDSNTFPMNFVLHPLSGAAYYGIPRAAGLSVPGAFGVAVAATMLWEFGLEFNERLSINDLVMTPIGGLPLGEFFQRLARYLNSAPGGGGRFQRAFGATLGVAQLFHDRVFDDRRGTPDGTVTDTLGYDASIAHRFQLDYGFGLARTDGRDRFGRHEVTIRAELAVIPGYGRPGRFRRFFGDADLTRFLLRGLGGPHGSGIELHADTVLLGYYAQDVRATPRGLRGGGLSVGAGLGYTFRRDDHADFVDLLGTTQLPGLAVDATAFVHRAVLRFRGRLHGEFAGIRSLAFDAWERANPGVETKSVLERYGYYYAWGYSAHAALELETAYVGLGAEATFARYASHEGLDRHQEDIDAAGIDIPASDRIVDAEVYLRVRPVPRVPVHLELAASRRRRTSHVDTFREANRFERLSLRLGVIF